MKGDNCAFQELATCITGRVIGLIVDIFTNMNTYMLLSLYSVKQADVYGSLVNNEYEWNYPIYLSWIDTLDPSAISLHYRQYSLIHISESLGSVTTRKMQKISKRAVFLLQII